MARRRAANALSPKRLSPIMLALVLVIGTVLLASVAFKDSLNPSATKNGAIDFAATDFAGKPVRLSDYRGKPVLINLWASWCPPCRAEMPDLLKYYTAHQTEGLVFISVNSQDDFNAAQQFVREKQMTMPVLFDPEGKVARAFRTDGLPNTYFIDRAGNLRFSWTGQISPAVLEQRITPLLAQ